MKLGIFFLCIALLCQSYSTFAQEYSYTHYDITDGLAGAVVYCITQDKDGFMWIGTETGVSRFDGTHFKTFTVTDGLPDIEVLEMYGDSKGRVWMAPFTKSICYYYQGKIHNQDNDSALHSIHLKENVEHFAEDARGDILIQERTALQLFGVDGSLKQYDSIGGHPIRECAAISRSASGDFLVQEGQQVFTFSRNHSSFYCGISVKDVSSSYIAMNPAAIIWRVDMTHAAIRSFHTGTTTILPFERTRYKHLTFTAFGDSLFYYNEFSGSTEYNLYDGRIKHFLPGKEVSRTFKDATGSLWFTTMGQGIYRLNSDEFKTITLRAPGTDHSGVHAISRIGDALYIGDDHDYVFIYSLPAMRRRSKGTIGHLSRNRILFLGRMPNGHIYWGADAWLAEGDKSYSNPRSILAGIKDVAVRTSNEIYISTPWGVALADLRTFRITDTLWRERSTCIYNRNDTLFIGTLSGLYQLYPDRRSIFLGQGNPILRKRVSSIVESADHTLWVASYDAGVIGYKNGRIVARITTQQGLTSDICRTLKIDHAILWVGTDKGLNKVALDLPGYPVTQYTSKDGLGSDMINSIYTDSSMIYVGTPVGLSYFNKSKVNISDSCKLLLLAVLNSGKDILPDSGHMVIPYQDKHVRVEFAGISYRSVGSMVYRYRLLGLDSAWQETKETFLEYPTLPSGKYTLQLQAINKFGNKSELLTLPFEVATPIWQTLWFYSFILVGFLLLVWFFVSLRIKSIRRRQVEKEQLSWRLAELENTAMKSQMNPHFIFNCLTSIQHYIFEHEPMAANKYLTGFAKLIRATLYNSSKAFISLTDEVDYLSTYLSLEKLRFKEKMDYAVEVDPQISKDVFLIPPMLIQPFVENSIRHGLRHKTEGGGFIRIHFSLSGANRLAVSVEDNGIGRKNAARYRTKEHISYQSKGITLTTDRVRMMNSKYDGNIEIEVIDLEKDPDQPAGTRIVILLPLFHLTTQTQFL